MSDALPDEQKNPYEGANEHFEGVGRLYYRRYHRLRPGKDEPAECGRDSMDEDNLRQFQDWIKHEAFEDAIRRIDMLEAKLEAYRPALEDIAGIADEALGRKPRG
jgi:hypothetical protein